MRIAILMVVVLFAGCATAFRTPAGISQFVEIREGCRSVWGVDIQLKTASFQPQIASNQIVIREAKYSRDLRSIMEWAVSKDRKSLHIHFKPGCGDFGTGNSATVYIDKSALIGYTGANNRLEWEIGTDVQ